MSGISSQVQRAIHTGTDQIDWGKTFDIIERLNKHQNERQPSFQAIYNFIARGARRERLNAINFIDALFKNGDLALLKALQSSPEILALGNEKIQNDPFCHRTVTKLIPEWVKACNEKDCITPQFQQWAKDTTSYQFQYQLTPKIVEKFRTEFQNCIDMLQMFTGLLTEAAKEHKTADDELIQEIFPNILEIHNRLKELAISMPDQYIVSVINYLCEFCEECISAFRTLSSTGFVDVSALESVSLRGLPKQGTPVSSPDTLSDVKAPESPTPASPVPAPFPQPPNTRPIVPVQPQSPPPTAGNLIDFDMPANQAPQYPKNDELLDFGIPSNQPQNQIPNQNPNQNLIPNPYTQNATPPMQGFNPYQQTPYQQNPYQQTPYQQTPYQQNPYQQNPYPPVNQGNYGSGGYGNLPQSQPLPNQQNQDSSIQKPPSNFKEFEFADE